MAIFDFIRNSLQTRLLCIYGKTNDIFINELLLPRKIEEVLHQELKAQGYRRIVFYSRSRGAYFYDLESKKLWQNDSNETEEIDDIFVDEIIAQPPADNSRDRLSYVASGAEFLRIASAFIRQTEIPTAIVLPNGTEALKEFSELDNGKQVDEFFSSITKGGLDQIGNKNIFVLLFNRSSSQWEDVLNDVGRETVRKYLTDYTVVTQYHLPAPNALDIRRMLNYFRLHGYKGKKLEIDCRDLDIISEMLAERIRKNFDEAGNLPEKSQSLMFATINTLVSRFIEPGVMLDQVECGKLCNIKAESSEKKLEELIGLNGIKESIKKIKAYALMNKGSDALNIHMCFLGNPGTGKTEVARSVAGILYENKILPTMKVIEVDRSGLVGEYVGATAIKTQNAIARAMGGVLFVDEAYALGNNADIGCTTDYGSEAINTLVKAMEDYRGKFCVIFAGYRNEMQKMLSMNSGLRSRIQFTLDFPNYTHEELKEITMLMLKKRKYTIGEAALSRLLDITNVRRKDPNFANAREIRNILDQVIMCQNLRCAGTDDTEIGIVDVNKYIKDARISLPTSSKVAAKKILTGEEELDQMIGLSVVKRMVKKIKAYARHNQGSADFNLHMCFYGNPGTGKTEVARILSRILYDAGVLDEAKLVETNAHGLIGKYVGETAPKTLAKINEAMGGVLFIDEAYSLAGGTTVNGGYGKEAIDVLLKEMEDRKGQFCTILAGYRDEMIEMISTNPGFESRIQFTLEFPDYTREELGLIAQSFLEKKGYAIDDAALNHVLNIAEAFRNRSNFANARTVRNILDHVIMNQNVRADENIDDRMIIVMDVDEYLKELEDLGFIN